MRSAIDTVVNGVKTTASTAWNAIKTTIDSVINSIKSGISSGLNAVQSTVSSILGFAVTMFAIGYELGKDVHGHHHDKTQK